MKRKQLILNIIANFLSVLVSLLVSLFLTPYIVLRIGKEAYSFVPISNNFTSYLWILSTAFTSMTARFVTIRVHSNDIDAANDYYSTSFFTNLIIVFISSIICLAIILNLNIILNIPENIFSDVQFLFIIIFTAFIINVATNSFSLPAFCMNRLDISSIIGIISIVARLIVVIVLFAFFAPKVYFIGLSVLVVIVTQGILNIFVAKRIMPNLIISLKHLKLKIIYELFTAGIWNSFTQLSSILITGLDLLIANIMLGTSASGILAVAKTAPMALQMLINVVPTAFNPYLTILYAKEDRVLFNSELKYTLKFTSIITGIPIAGFIALSSVFFKLWVPSVASTELTILAILTMISMVASFCIMPLFYIFTITNKLKWPAVSIFVTGILNILFVFLIIKKTNFGLYAIAGVSSIFEVIRCLIFVPMYAAFCLNERLSFFYDSIYRSLIFMFILIITFSIVVFIFPIKTWFLVLISACLMIILGILIGFSFLLNDKERGKATAIVKDFIKRQIVNSGSKI
ncbi:MAG TPA: hypothetical protein VIK86_09555 [Candidatus Paceibacterota bacterium]